MLPKSAIRKASTEINKTSSRRYKAMHQNFVLRFMAAYYTPYSVTLEENPGNSEWEYTEGDHP
jgi:hypothetical protein